MCLFVSFTRLFFYRLLCACATVRSVCAYLRLIVYVCVHVRSGVYGQRHCIYMCICICVYTVVYACTGVEREREPFEQAFSMSLNRRLGLGRTRSPPRTCSNKEQNKNTAIEEEGEVSSISGRRCHGVCF